MTVGTAKVGDLVTALYKTGEYIGEVVELTSSSKAAVKILSVVKHPTQGDLHQPMDASVAFFHQRRALAHQEIALMPLSTVRLYQGEVTPYQDTLIQSLRAEIAELSNMEQWAKRSLQELQQLTKEYFPV
jgi:kinase-associated protein B